MSRVYQGIIAIRLNGSMAFSGAAIGIQIDGGIATGSRSKIKGNPLPFVGPKNGVNDPRGREGATMI